VIVNMHGRTTIKIVTLFLPSCCLLFCHICLLVAYVMQHSIPEIHPDKSVYPSQKTLNMKCIAKSNGLTLFGEIITVCTENHRTHTNSLPATHKLYHIYLNA
jgi:hypothetical protein